METELAFRQPSEEDTFKTAWRIREQTETKRPFIIVHAVYQLLR